MYCSIIGTLGISDGYYGYDELRSPIFSYFYNNALFYESICFAHRCLLQAFFCIFNVNLINFFVFMYRSAAGESSE